MTRSGWLKRAAVLLTVISLLVVSGWNVSRLNPGLLWVVGLVVALTILTVWALSEVEDNTKSEALNADTLKLSAKVNELTKTVDAVNSAFNQLSNQASEFANSAWTLRESVNASVEIRDYSSQSLRAEVDLLMAGVREQFQDVQAEVQGKGFTLIWNSLPYSDRFSTFSMRDKALYFDAITTGNWSALNAKLRAKS